MACQFCTMPGGAHDAPCPYDEKLCDDEGCPHYGTPHVCVTK